MICATSQRPDLFWTPPATQCRAVSTVNGAAERWLLNTARRSSLVGPFTLARSMATDPSARRQRRSLRSHPPARQSKRIVPSSPTLWLASLPDNRQQFPNCSRSPDPEKVQHRQTEGLFCRPIGPKFALEAFWGIGVRWRAKNSALGGKAQGLWGCLSSLWRQQRRLTGRTPPVSVGFIKRDP